MKQLIKTMTAICLAVIMAFSVVAIATAVENTTDAETTKITITTNDEGTKAYTLVWKYKSENGHMYKRRWNETLNCWYDPAWILVY